MNTDFNDESFQNDASKTNDREGTAFDRESRRQSQDPFDLNSLRLSQNFGDVGVKKAIVSIPVKKPDKQIFFRVHPSAEFLLQTAVLEMKDDATYLVSPDLWVELSSEIVPKIIVTAITLQGNPFLWPIRLPGDDGKIDEWNRTALEASNMAQTSWIRLVSNRGAGSYDVFQAIKELPEPAWPDMDFQKMIKIAFKDRIITSMDHPVVRKLRGEL